MGKKIPQLIDMGANLFYPEFEPYIDTLFRRSYGAGVTHIALISVDYDTTKKNIDLAKRYLGSFWVIAGVHPSEAQKFAFNEENLNKLRTLIQENRKLIKAIGECGFDNHKEKMPEMSFQRDWFLAQLNLAVEFDLPLFIHERDCHEETTILLKKHVSEHPKTKILINCFSGTQSELETYLNISPNVYIVMTGVIGNEVRGTHLRDFVRMIPLNRILLGSDAPYLTPFNMNKPFPRRNEPGFLGHILVALSDYMGVDMMTLSEATVKNSYESFNMNPQVNYYNGTVSTKRREILYTNLQQIEDERQQIINQKAQPVKIILLPGFKVLSLQKYGLKKRFIVEEKEYPNLHKNLTSLGAEDFLVFIKSLNLNEVPSHGFIVDRRKKRRKKNV